MLQHHQMQQPTMWMQQPTMQPTTQDIWLPSKPPSVEASGSNMVFAHMGQSYVAQPDRTVSQMLSSHSLTDPTAAGRSSTPYRSISSEPRSRRILQDANAPLLSRYGDVAAAQRLQDATVGGRSSSNLRSSSVGRQMPVLAARGGNPGDQSYRTATTPQINLLVGPMSSPDLSYRNDVARRLTPRETPRLSRLTSSSSTPRLTPCESPQIISRQFHGLSKSTSQLPGVYVRPPPPPVPEERETSPTAAGFDAHWMPLLQSSGSCATLASEDSFPRMVGFQSDVVNLANHLNVADANTLTHALASLALQLSHNDFDAALSIAKVAVASATAAQPSWRSTSTEIWDSSAAGSSSEWQFAGSSSASANGLTRSPLSPTRSPSVNAIDESLIQSEPYGIQVTPNAADISGYAKARVDSNRAWFSASQKQVEDSLTLSRMRLSPKKGEDAVQAKLVVRQKVEAPKFDSSDQLRSAVEQWMTNQEDAKIKYGDIGKWDVSRITDMSGLFEKAEDFNEDIGSWNVANVTDMSRMFKYATSFNQDIGRWDVGKVVNMEQLFCDASVFNQDISRWNVTSVTSMTTMFRNAHSFNKDISFWNVSKITNMRGMFTDAGSFNKALGRWNVANVWNMEDMFKGALQFNQDLNTWNVGSVRNMYCMFQNATSFNRAIGCWDVSNVTNLGGMFNNAASFNQEIGSWNVAKVTSMHNLFNSAKAFKQDISRWNVSSVKKTDSMFKECELSDRFKPAALKALGKT